MMQCGQCVLKHEAISGTEKWIEREMPSVSAWNCVTGQHIEHASEQ